jgi:uncharacterized membrane protein
MDYRLSYLSTLIVVVLAVAIGVVSSLIVRDGIIRYLWAALVAVVFVAAGCCAVIFEYSWMFTNATRAMAQAVTIGAALTGIIYATRAQG